MAYIGRNINNLSDRVKLDSISTSATATFNLLLNSVAYVPSSAESLTVSLNGVIQAPQSSYTVSGSTIIFASNLASSDVIDFILAERAITLSTIGSGTVTTSNIVDANVTTAKIADNAVTSAKLASGLLPTNTPAFFVIKTGNQSVSASTSTLVTFNSEKFDSDNKFDTSTGKFTPASAGKYFLLAQMNIQAIHDQATTEFDIKQNGSYVNSRFKHIALNSSSDREPSIFTSCIVDSDADDYFQVFTHTDFGSGTTITGDANGFTFFGGYKLIGA